VSELAGSGDAGASNQRFRLRQAPLTYVTAANPAGRESTLEVRVNDLLWHEAPTLFAQPGAARVYSLRQDDEGRTTTQFGDGVEGARLPSGTNNIRMTYRKGLGLAGNVRAETITTLVSRPLGVKAVENPIAAAGGADAESRDDARRNVPKTVLTLDRAVSVRDYEDFARSFAGISKALAVFIPAGRARGVHITVAGIAGAAVSSASETSRALSGALRAFGDALVPLSVQSFVSGTFQLVARIKTAPDFVSDDVLAQVDAALRRDFGFEAQDLSEPVTLDAVVASIHAVPGVVAVDVDQLHRTGVPPGPQPEARLFPAVPSIQPDGTVSAAELLTLDPQGLTLSRLS
jgi:predicted phage baseplate assembly protein